MKPILTLFLALGMLAADLANDLFQQALKKERTEGNLAEAIRLYQQIVDKHSGNRRVAAQALLQLAECQSKLGDVQSRRSLERLLKEFADQKDAADQARARLARMGGGVPTVQQARLVWSNKPDNAYGASLSSDGRYMSYPEWRSGNLGLRDLLTGSDRMLTSNGTYQQGQTRYAEGTAISRDGRQVAYAWYDDRGLRYGLRVVNVNGDSAPRTLVDEADIGWIHPTDWSPDGKWIAVHECTPRSNAKQGCHSALVSAQDGTMRVLRPVVGMGTARLLFSPDGRYLLRAQEKKIFVLPLAGGTEVPLLAEPSSVESAVWTPDGSKVFFVSDRSGSPALWAASVKDGKPEGEPALVRTGFSASLLAFTRDGGLAYAQEQNLTDVYVAGLNGETGTLTSEPRRVNEVAIGNSWGRVAWLTDGKSLSFWHRAPMNALVVHTLATREERELWNRRTLPRGLGGWFPDGKSLMSQQLSEKALVFRRMDGKTLEVQATWTTRPLPEGVIFDHQAEYSPDLMTLYYSRRDACTTAPCSSSLMARSVTTGQDQEVLRLDSGLPTRIIVSPDGSNLAFRIGGDRLMVVPTKGGAPREVFRRGQKEGWFTGMAWSRDGKRILAFHRTQLGGELLSIPVDGGPVHSSPIKVTPSEQPAVSPDGTQIAFVGGNWKSEIWMLTGLLADPRPVTGR